MLFSSLFALDDIDISLVFYRFVTQLVKRFLDRTKGVLTQSEGLGYLQIYNLIKTAGIVVVSIIFAKIIPNPLIINSWETILLLGTGFTFFYVSGLGYTLVSFIKQFKNEQRPIIFKNTFVLLFIFSIFSSICILFTAIYIPSISLPVSQLIFFCIYIVGNVCSTVVEYIYFLNKSYYKLLGWGILNFIIFILAPTIPLILEYDFIYSMYALAAFGVLKFGVTLRLIGLSFRLNQLNYLKPLLIFNWPVIVSLLFGTGYIYCANFILKDTISVNDFNLFRYGSREFPLFIVMANSFSIVLGGITAEKFNTLNYWDEIKKSHLRLMHQLFPLACILMLSSKYLFQLVYSDSFISAYTIFNILMLTIIARVLFPQSLLMGKGKTRYAFYSALLEFIIGIGLVLILTPNYGIVGAAFALSLAYFTEKLILILFCYQQNIPFHKSINLKWLVAYILLLILCFGFSMRFN